MHPIPSSFLLIACRVGYQKLQLHKYMYGLFMPAADRSLDAVFRCERPDTLHVKQMMAEVAWALEHLHSKRVIHGDVKMLNILRVDNRMRLIDLDASCKVRTLANLSPAPSTAY
jgi:serine/threonine protein kinase